VNSKNAALPHLDWLGTLFRPETPLVLISCFPVVLWVTLRRSQISKVFALAFCP
jgi:hypothetical protein